MRYKLLLIIVIVFILALNVFGQTMAETLTDTPNEFLPIMKKVESPFYKGSYYNYEYMSPEEKESIMSAKFAELDMILEAQQTMGGANNNLTGDNSEEETSIYEGITLPPVDPNLTLEDAKNIYIFFDIEQTWEKYIEERLIFEPLEETFDIVEVAGTAQAAQDGQTAVDSFYETVLEKRDELNTQYHEDDREFVKRLLTREIMRKNLITWLDLKEQQVLEEIDDYIKQRSGNDNKGTTKVIGRVRKATPYETLLGAPIPENASDVY